MNKVANIFISLVFLIAFSGVQINKHYSQGKLYSVAVFNDAQNCCATMEACQTANVPSGQVIHNHRSCKNETQWVKITDNFLLEKFSMPNEKVHSLCTRALSAKSQTEQSVNELQSFIYFSPVHIKTNLLTEFGVFRC